MRHRYIAATGFALLLALAACQAPADREPELPADLSVESEPEPTVAELKGPAVETNLEPAAKVSVAYQPVESDAAVGAPPAEVKTTPAPMDRKIDDDPAGILGLDRDQLGSRLGRPALVRREPPAEIWQYHGDTCIFDVFLYEDAGAHRVTYLEARDEAAQKIDLRGCLRQILRARALSQSLG